MSRETKIGIVAFILLFFMGAAGLFLEPSRWFHKDFYEIHAVFDNAQGIRDHAQVLYAGVSVGRVSRIHVKDGKAVLDLDIREGTVIPEDARFTIDSSGVVGDIYVKISGGRPGSRNLSDGMTVIVHDREAHGDCLAIIKEFPTVTGVFHCFSGSPEMAAELLKRGWYLGFDGPITYKNAKRAPEVAAITPLDRMVVETDAPYMAPVPMRGKRNDSRYLPYVIEKLAEWKGVTAEEMTRVTWENGRRLFRI